MVLYFQSCTWRDSIKPCLRISWFCVFFVNKGNPFLLLFYILLHCLIKYFNCHLVLAWFTSYSGHTVPRETGVPPDSACDSPVPDHKWVSMWRPKGVFPTSRDVRGESCIRKKSVPRRFLCCSSSLCVGGFILGVCFVIISSFFWRLGRALLHDCGIIWVPSLFF